MPNNKMRTSTALLAFVVISLLTAAVSGCGADNDQAPAAGQIEILEIKVENEQYAAPDLDPAGISVGDMDVFSGSAIKDGRKVGHGVAHARSYMSTEKKSPRSACSR